MTVSQKQIKTRQGSHHSPSLSFLAAFRSDLLEHMDNTIEFAPLAPHLKKQGAQLGPVGFPLDVALLIWREACLDKCSAVTGCSQFESHC